MNLIPAVSLNVMSWNAQLPGFYKITKAYKWRCHTVLHGALCMHHFSMRAWSVPFLRFVSVHMFFKWWSSDALRNAYCWNCSGFWCGKWQTTTISYRRHHRRNWPGSSLTQQTATSPVSTGLTDSPELDFHLGGPFSSFWWTWRDHSIQYCPLCTAVEQRCAHNCWGCRKSELGRLPARCQTCWNITALCIHGGEKFITKASTQTSSWVKQTSLLQAAEASQIVFGQF